MSLSCNLTQQEWAVSRNSIDGGPGDDSPGAGVSGAVRFLVGYCCNGQERQPVLVLYTHWKHQPFGVACSESVRVRMLSARAVAAAPSFHHEILRMRICHVSGKDHLVGGL